MKKAADGDKHRVRTSEPRPTRPRPRGCDHGTHTANGRRAWEVAHTYALIQGMRIDRPPDYVRLGVTSECKLRNGLDEKRKCLNKNKKTKKGRLQHKELDPKRGVGRVPSVTSLRRGMGKCFSVAHRVVRLSASVHDAPLLPALFEVFANPAILFSVLRGKGTNYGKTTPKWLFGGNSRVIEQ